MAAREILLTGRGVTLIDKAPSACRELGRLLPSASIVEGDAMDEDVLLRAGVRDARALIAALHQDKMNLVVTVTALQLHPALRVICRSDDETQWPRLRRAGATVVSSAHIGGRRLATGIVRREGVSFLNEMLAAPTREAVRFEAVLVTEGSEAAGRSPADLDLFRRTGLHLAAVCRGPGGDFLCNPGPDVRIAPGDRLIVIGDRSSVDRLAAIVGRWE